MNLNDLTNFTVLQKPAPDFSPPQLKRAVVATLLRDGDYIPASAYSNRVLVFTVLVEGTSKDNWATNMQLLGRELDRQFNVLKYQSEGATNPVFFRTHRSPEYDIIGEAFDETVNRRQLRLRVIAEPFAYGLRVDQSPVTVNNDPAAGSNPCYFDVTAVTGDVPTPGFFKMTGTTQSGLAQLMAVRRHGTPGGVHAIQAEAMSQGTDTTVQLNDATASGAGSNYSRTTFATVQALGGSARLTATFPAADSIENRGIYRVFARVRRSDAATVMQVQMRSSIGSFGFAGPIVTLPLQTYWMWIDIGMIGLPLGVQDPVTEGYSNVAQSVGNIFLVLDAGSASAVPDLDWDVMLAVPADENLCIIDWKDGGGNTDRVMDGPRDACYTRNVSAVIEPQAPSNRAGDIPELQPNQTNRIAMLRSVGGNASDLITQAQLVTVSFWPRWLYIRP